MDSTAVAARAALDAARAVFGTMTSTGTTGAPPSTPAGRALAAWKSAENILRTVTGRTELTGQALVGEARRTERLTLGDAHVLVALFGWMERLQNPDEASGHVLSAPTDQERSVGREALLALEHAVATVQRESAGSAAGSARDFSNDATGDLTRGVRATSPYAPPVAGAGFAAATASTSSYERARGDGTRTDGQRIDGTRADVPNDPIADSYDDVAPRRGFRASPGLILGGIAVLLLIGVGLWYAFGAGRNDAYAEGTAAYTQGSREAARIAFARAATDKPDDPRPLVYLGRIAREDGDLPRARRFLERAVRLAPGSAVAQREMAATMLADGNPEIARRFYVRALEIDPTDKLAQGFLACALHRLGRFDDARRFVERAGTGEWTPCLSTPVTPVMPGAMMPGMPMPQGGVPQPLPPR